jgi:hypothetical protein
VDGEAVSEDPTVSGTTGGAFGEAFVSATFEAAFSERIVNVRLGQAKSSDRSDESEKAKGKARAVRMSALSRLDLPGQPTAPRLRLLDPTETEVLWQWIEPGEQTIVSYSASGSDLVAAFEPPVARVLSLERKRAEESGSASGASVNRLVLPLVVESDAPCRVILAQAHLEFLLSAEFLTAPADLSFDGSSRQARAVGLPSVPTDPVRLDVEATFAFLAARATEEPELTDASRFSGAVLEMGSAFAIPWEADRPYWLSGFSVGWYCLSETAILKLSLFPDAAGQIAARPIVEGGANVSLAGAGWARCTWTPIPLQPGRYWLKLSVGAGAGLWLGAAVAQPTTIWAGKPSER